jgi:two-component sensor histidine kinase
VTNSFRHAFCDGTGTLALTLTQQDGWATMVMADDGEGMPENATHGLGLSLIDILVKQPRATRPGAATGGERA